MSYYQTPYNQALDGVRSARARLDVEVMTRLERIEKTLERFLEDLEPYRTLIGGHEGAR